MAASSVLRSLVGGLAPLFSHKLYQKFDVGWAFSLLAFIALAFAPVPWIFYRYGDRWRKNERFEARMDGEPSEGDDGAVGGDKSESYVKVDEVKREIA